MIVSLSVAKMRGWTAQLCWKCAVRAKTDSKEGNRSRPHGQIGAREKLKEARLAEGFDAERAVRGGFANLRQFGAGNVRLEFLYGAEAGSAIASADLKSGASSCPHDSEMPGTFCLGTEPVRRG